MKINIIKNKVEEVIATVERICSKKGDLNILNFFQLRVKNGEIIIFATDLEISFQAQVVGRIETEGEILLPAKQFAQIINNFYDDELVLEKKENSLLVKGENSISSLAGLIEEEYPFLAEVNKDKYLEIESSVLDEYLSKVYPALRTSEIFKPELNGVYLVFSDKGVVLVTTDTLRLSEAVIKKQFYSSNIEALKVLIPKKIVQEYLSIKRKPHKVKLYFESHQVAIDLDNQLLSTKLMLADYPDYKRVIPETFTLSLLAPKADLLNSLKLNKVFLDQVKEIRLRVMTKEQLLELYSKNELLGETVNKIKVQIKDNELAENDIFETRLNFDFLQDGLSVIESEKIFIGLNQVGNEGNKPVLIKSPLEENFIYIVMPL